MGTAQHDMPAARTDIERQAIERLDSDPTIDAITLVSHLDVSHWLHTDVYAGWHAKTALEPMLRALFVRELLGCRDPDSHYTKTDHEHRIRESGVAEQLGFNLAAVEQAPCRTTYDSTWNNRLSDALRQYLAHTAERVRDYAHENGIFLELNALDSELDDKSDASRSTKDRAIRRTTRQILTQITDLIFPLADFGRADNVTYETEMYLGAECLMSLNGLAAEQGMELYADNVAALAGERFTTDAASSENDTVGMRSTERAWIGIDFTISPAESAAESPPTLTGNAYLRTSSCSTATTSASSCTRASV